MDFFLFFIVAGISFKETTVGYPFLSIAKLVNYSLSEGSLPDAFEKAVVTPHVKKASPPGNELKNYCSVPGLCFLSNLVEYVVAKQITSHVNSNELDNSH